MAVPVDRRYTAEHEWVRLDGDTATVGITEYAAEKLGDVVFVDLPQAGSEAAEGSVVGEIESTKSVGELFAPVTGEVVEANDAVASSPELVNSDPYGEGWLIRVRVAEPARLEELLDATAYAALIGDGE
ncbi:glycine cleavage system protein GcvH [Humibacter albus]|jgi:glycine cleavage system H protein|uniref:glycine cleavage system protein GcvH n=1 Tax=Humibacter albus TaxID=427754 RepID=UPI0003B39A78|nr:glycine cleavage system protein GcvH [Humibacter albus]